MTTEAETGRMLPWASAPGSQELEESRNRFSLRASEGSMALLTSSFWTSGLRSHERTHFYGLSHLVCDNW